MRGMETGLAALLLAGLVSACELPTRPSSLALRVSVEAPDSVEIGESVSVGIRLENVSDRRVTVWPTVARELAFDLRVLREGREVWRAWSGLLTGPGGRPFDLEPGRSVTETKRWELRDDQGDPVAPGSYTLEGTVHLVPAMRLRAERTLVVTAP